MISIMQCVVILIQIPWLDIEEWLGILSYVLVGSLIILQIIVKLRLFESSLIKIVIYFTLIIFYTEYSDFKLYALISLTLQMVQLDLVDHQRLYGGAVLNIYCIFRLQPWPNVDFQSLVGGLILVGIQIHLNQKKKEIDLQTTMDSNYKQTLNNKIDLPLNNQSPNLSKQPLKSPHIVSQNDHKHSLIRTPNQNNSHLWDSTSIINETINDCFHFFNLVPDGFAVISPNNLHVHFCNTAMLSLFKITEKNQLRNQIEQLKNILPIQDLERGVSETLNREPNSSIPSYQSFTHSLKAASPRRLKHKLSIRARVQDDDSNPIINDIVGVNTDYRYLRNQPLQTQLVGIYLANQQQQEQEKRLFEVVIYQTIIEERVTVLLQVRDVTHRDYIKGMKQSLKAKSNSINFVSHEFRTPLFQIMQYLSALIDEVEDPKQVRYLKIIQNNSSYLLNLSNDLLDLAQIKIGKFTIQLIEFDLKKLIDECLDMFKLQAETKKVDLLFTYRKNVPATIINDPFRIKQIIINLLGNAFKFTTQGYIGVNVCMENQLIKIECRDTGIGIREEDKSKLVHAFEKVHSEENKKLNSQGVGLGLLISNTIAKNLQKDQIGLQFESVYGHGSCFFFYVSRNMKDQIYDEIQEVSDEENSINEESPQRRMSIRNYIIQNKTRIFKCRCASILICDDNAFNIDALKEMIKKMFPKVKIDCALNGFIAIEYVKRNKCATCLGYKIVFMDIEMPGISGFQTTREIRQIAPKLFIVGTSAYALQSEKQQASESGMDTYLNKPVTKEDLRQLISQFIQQ